MAMHTGWDGLLLGAEEGAESHAPLDAYDLVVIGGTLFGCFAARHAARRGLRVLLIERRTFLGTEITATLRPWLQRQGFESFDNALRELLLPKGEQSEVGVPFALDDSTRTFGEDVPLFCGSVKKQLMATLVKDGVRVLLMTGVWGVLSDEGQENACGAALANKFGLQIVRCSSILDTTGRRSPCNSSRQGEYSFSLEFYGVDDGVDPVINVPKSLGLQNDNLFLHRGKRMPGQFLAEFHFAAERDDAENEARRKTEKLCKYLIEQHPAFAAARLVQMAWETLELTDRKDPDNERYNNYICVAPVGVHDLSCEDVVDIEKRAAALVGTLSPRQDNIAQAQYIDHAHGRIPMHDCQFAPLEGIRLDLAFQSVTFPFERHVPESLRTDVVIAGGGTAGAPAAMAALEQSTPVVTVEYFPELGGTKTLGGVMGYYWGYRDTAVFDRIEEGLKQQATSLGAASSRVLMMSYFRKQATRNSGRLYTNCIVCGVTRDQNRVTGLIAEKNGSLSILRGKMFVDATGDGDVAALAGAEWQFGDRRMNATQNYSQWDANPGLGAWKDSSTNRDYDILMNQYLPELQRGYELTHQESHYYDFMPMLTVRESRRIQGDYTITLRDVIENRHHRDTICLARSDYDPHYFGDTAWTRAGCLLPHGISAVVEIPYRALLPKGIDGLLVSAKAISQTHNALQFTRMSADIMTLGYMTGRIAAHLSQKGIDTRDFDVSSFRQTLVQLRVVPPERIEKTASVMYDADYVGRRVDDLEAAKTDALIRVSVLPRQMVEPLLMARLARIGDEASRLRIAKALAWFGHSGGNALILEEMRKEHEKECAAGSLPWEYYRKDGETNYWTINQDIALLGLSGDHTALPAILALADSLKLGNPPVQQETAYNRGRIDLRLIPYYNRIINICFAIEQMPDRQAIRTLCCFLDDPYIQDSVARTPDMASDKLYAGILESRIAATLARCGAKRGFDVLAMYLSDIHHLLARYAHDELTTLLSVDFGYDGRRWAQYIKSLSFPLEPCPRRANTTEW